MKTLKEIKEERERKIVKDYLYERELKPVDLRTYCKVQAAVECSESNLRLIQSELMTMVSKLDRGDESWTSELNMINMMIRQTEGLLCGANATYHCEVKI